MATRAAVIKLLKRLEENEEFHRFIIDPKTIDYSLIAPDDPWFKYGHPWFNEPYFYVDETPFNDADPSPDLIDLLARIEVALSDYLFGDAPWPDDERVEALAKLGYAVFPRTTLSDAWLMAAVRLSKGVYVFR